MYVWIFFGKGGGDESRVESGGGMQTANDRASRRAWPARASDTRAEYINSVPSVLVLQQGRIEW